MATKFQLPEAMIQHIQSFLNGKEAARTTLLSKSWYNAWLTRPNLDFDLRYFKKEKDKEEKFWKFWKFWKFVGKIVQRYDKLNLKIHSLRLFVPVFTDEEYGSYVNELIVKAMKLGVADLNLRFHWPSWKFILPPEVFGSENLIMLSVRGCKICIGADGDVRCSRLKSLTFDAVLVSELSDIMSKIISRCPLIESLSASHYPRFSSSNVGLVVNGFRNLKCLTLDRCYCDYVMKISSPSLECINLNLGESYSIMRRAKFDVPNIRKFTFSSPIVPSISFEATKGSWESHISIINCGHTHPSGAWFLRLNKLLKRLSLSKVSLSLSIFSEEKIDCAGEIPGLTTKPEVESLTIDGPCSVDPGFFYRLFQCCRPIYITQHWSRMVADDFMKIVYKRMMHHVSLNSCSVYQKTSALCNIEEVGVEFYDESVSAWRPRVLDTSTSLGADEERIRLHLRWGH